MAWRVPRQCKHPGCEAFVRARLKTGLCRKHYLSSPQLRANMSTIRGGLMAQVPVDKHDEYRDYVDRKRLSPADAFALVTEGKLNGA